MGKKKNKKEINKNKGEDLVEISYTQTDVRSFLEKFKADVARKRKEYQEYVQEHRKKQKRIPRIYSRV